MHRLEKRRVFFFLQPKITPASCSPEFKPTNKIQVKQVKYRASRKIIGEKSLAIVWALSSFTRSSSRSFATRYHLVNKEAPTELPETVDVAKVRFEKLPLVNESMVWIKVAYHNPPGFHLLHRQLNK